VRWRTGDGGCITAQEHDESLMKQTGFPFCGESLMVFGKCHLVGRHWR